MYRWTGIPALQSGRRLPLAGLQQATTIGISSRIGLILGRKVSDDRGGTAIYVGQTYRLFQQRKGDAYAYVVGEFYWKRRPMGEEVRSRRRTSWRRRHMLSFERTSDNGRE